MTNHDDRPLGSDFYDPCRILLPAVRSASLIVFTFTGIRTILRAPKGLPGLSNLSQQLAGLSQILLGAVAWYSTRSIAAKIDLVNSDRKELDEQQLLPEQQEQLPPTQRHRYLLIADLLERPRSPLSRLSRECLGWSAAGLLIHGALANTFLAEKDGLICAWLHASVGFAFSASFCSELDHYLRNLVLLFS